MKRFLAVCLAVLLCVSFALAEEESEEEQNTLQWVVNNDNTLTVWLAENISTGYEWSCTISDPELIEQIAEEYEADESDLEGAGGIWSASFRPVAGQAGLVTITFLYARAWLDEPELLVPMEIYLDGTGFPQVLTVNGEVITELDI